MSLTVVLGGARSGKSTFAESLLDQESAVDYVATAPHRPGDEEWAQRVLIHQQRRPSWWRTIETTDLVALLSTPGPATLIDCMGVWLTTQLDEVGAWQDAAGNHEALAARTAATIDAFAATTRRVIAVSNEVGLGVVPATSSGRRFRDDLGRLNMALAQHANEVWFVVAGLPQRLK